MGITLKKMRDIIKMLGLGHTRKEICAELDLKESTLRYNIEVLRKHCADKPWREVWQEYFEVLMDRNGMPVSESEDGG